jgi:outer membrane protein W
MGLRYLLLVLLLSPVWGTGIMAQEVELKEKKPNGEHKFKPHSTLGVVISHAHLFSGVDENGNKKALSLSSWGLDYTYHLSPKWAVGLHTDIILESYKVEKHQGDQAIERSYPIAPAIVGIYKLNHHWNFLVGAGAEFAKEENFFLTRFGVEYGVEIRNGWEVFGSLAYDIKWDGYDSWLLGLGISKAFGRAHKHH